jgi:shikimate dehydrogenase
MHNAAFDAMKMNAEYLLRPAGPDDAQAVCSEIQYGKWLGLNVTTPMKTVMGSLVTLEGHAKRAGAVNTLWRYGADIHGALTDVDGIMKPLEQRQVEPGGYALILGAGGAARAAAIALDELGLRVNIAARNPDKAREFLSSMKVEHEGESMPLSNKEALNDAVSKASVIIQATPVGKTGEDHGLDWARAKEGAIAFDMVYKPMETPFLANARKASCRIIEGWEMLLFQGAASLKIWTGREAPLDAMKAALTASLK